MSTEAEFLQKYDPRDYDPVSVTVDLVILTIRDDELKVLLVERANHPWKGMLALPGGFVDPSDATLDEAARREVAEETGVDLKNVKIEQLRTYGDVGRDPRMRVITVAYLALIPDPGDAKAGSDASKAEWLPVWKVQGPDMAFDHAQILDDGIERARSKLEYTKHAFALLPDEFTISELRRVYELVWGYELDPSNFARKVNDLGLLNGLSKFKSTGGKPAALFSQTSSDDQILRVPIRREMGV